MGDRPLGLREFQVFQQMQRGHDVEAGRERRQLSFQILRENIGDAEPDRGQIVMAGVVVSHRHQRRIQIATGDVAQRPGCPASPRQQQREKAEASRHVEHGRRRCGGQRLDQIQRKPINRAKQVDEVVGHLASLFRRLPQTSAGLDGVQGVGIEQPPGAALVTGHRTDDIADRTLEQVLFAVTAVDPVALPGQQRQQLGDDVVAEIVVDFRRLEVVDHDQFIGGRGFGQRVKLEAGAGVQRFGPLFQTLDQQGVAVA